MFDDQDRLVAATFTFIFDLDESAILSPDRAQNKTIEIIQSQGYRLDGIGRLDEVQLRLPLKSARIQPRTAQYEWTTPVWGTGNASERATRYIGRITQDAQTGQILETAFEPGETAAGAPSTAPDGGEQPVDERDMKTSPDQDDTSPSVPGPQVGALLGVVLLVAWLWDSRRGKT